MKVGFRRKSKLVSGEQVARELNNGSGALATNKAHSSKAKWIILVIIFLLSTAAVYLVFVKKVFDNRSSEKSPDNSTLSREDLVIKDFGTEPIEKIISDNKGDSETTYMLLTSEASKKSYVGKYEDAIAYYKAAANVPGVSEFLQDEANISIYYLAKRVNDQALVDEYSQLLGAKIEDQANRIQDTEEGQSEE